MLVLFILAVVWAVYLVSWVRGKSSNRRVNSIHSFSSHLSILERTSGDEPVAPPVAPGTAPLLGGQYFAPRRPQLSAVKKRRRDVLFGLAGATGAMFLGVILIGGSFLLLLFVLSAAATGAYVFQLVQLRKRAEERSVKVRPIATSGAWAEGDSVDGGAFDDWSDDWSDDADGSDDRFDRDHARSHDRRDVTIVRERTGTDDVLGSVFGDLDGGSARAVGH